MSLLRTLFILAAIYFAVKFIVRFILPFLVKVVVNKVQENMMNKMDEMYEKQNNENEISIKRHSVKNKRHSDEGEYVDFEEIK